MVFGGEVFWRMNEIARGAESVIFLEKNEIIKERVKKGYRLKQIDEKLRKTRTKGEVKLLTEAKKNGIPVPQVLKKEENTIVMEFINGLNLKENLEKFSEKERKEICKKIGSNISLLHKAGMIHGDLTTSNMVYYNNEVYFIDFGLGFFSNKTEDRAVDLLLLEKALESKHYRISKECFDVILREYDNKEVIKKLSEIKKRGRYVER